MVAFKFNLRRYTMDKGRMAMKRVGHAVRHAGFAAEVVQFHKKDGTPLWCIVYAAPLWDPGSEPAADGKEAGAYTRPLFSST
jgi:hypothetical protein